jgi:hypothetical protein
VPVAEVSAFAIAPSSVQHDCPDWEQQDKVSAGRRASSVNNSIGVNGGPLPGATAPPAMMPPAYTRENVRDTPPITTAARPLVAETSQKFGSPSTTIGAASTE